MTAHRADDVIVRTMSALANVNRLAIMRSLRAPKALREIQVRDEGEGQVLARQTVRRHLDVLLEAGLAVSRDAGRGYGETSEFIVNHQRLFALSEEVRNLAKLRPSVELDVLTVPGGGIHAPVAKSPSLVLVKGLDEGRRFELDPTGGQRSWVVGRRRGLDVTLDFDPSTSSENAIVRWAGDHHTVENVAGSRNGTTHNFRPVGVGEQCLLRHGDILGVGRCLLVYWR